MKTRTILTIAMISLGTGSGALRAADDPQPAPLEAIPSYQAHDLLGFDPESRGWTFTGFEPVVAADPETMAAGMKSNADRVDDAEPAESRDLGRVVYRLALLDGSVYEKRIDLSRRSLDEDLVLPGDPGEPSVASLLTAMPQRSLAGDAALAAVARRFEPTVAESRAAARAVSAVGAPVFSNRPDESIIPSGNPYNPAFDDRWVVNSTTTLSSYPLRAVGEILNSSTGTAGGCSGSLIGPRHVLTAGHCVTQNGTWFWGTWFSPGHRGTGASRYTNGTPRQVVGLLSVTGWSVNGTWTSDYGMMLLKDEARTASLGWLGLGPFSNGYLSGKSMGVHGYPVWNQPCGGAGSPRADDACGAYMYYDWCTVANTWSAQLGYQCDTQPGQSGSPVWLWYSGEPAVIAVHAYGEGGRNDDRNRGTRLTSSRVSLLRDWICDFPSTYATYGTCN